jgi:hypothetical protein
MEDKIALVTGAGSDIGRAVGLTAPIKKTARTSITLAEDPCRIIPEAVDWYVAASRRRWVLKRKDRS